MTVSRPGILRRWVAGVTADSPSTVDSRRTFIFAPDTAPVLVFRTTETRRSDLLVVGPRTRASYHLGRSVPLCAQIRLRPARARPLLGVPMHQLVDQVVPLGDLWGPAGDRLTATLLDAGTDIDVISGRIGAALLDRLTAQTTNDLARTELLYSAAAGLSGAAGPRPERVGVIARRLSLSERHLRNLFADHVGVSPKRFARIDRVRRVLATADDRGWAELASTFGYYDQSHLTAEFRALMGVPPAAFAAGRLPAARSCSSRVRRSPTDPEDGRADARGEVDADATRVLAPVVSTREQDIRHSEE